MQISKNVTDRQAANGGIIFTVVICLGIVLLGTVLLQFELATQPENYSGFFYEWQLADPTFLSRATAWVGFGLHQILIWITIWWAIERSSRKYTSNLKPVNIAALAINAVFVVLHYAQTALFYDGIAQDIPSWTAQGAVIMMLFVIITMENRRRGVFFGKKIKFKAEFYRWLRDYHGYAFSFAVIYTFWFHPMIPTIGHIIGFAHVILVMVQGSLMFTKLHVNKKWIVLLEVMVLPHAVLVAVNQGGTIMYMFLFGFLTMLIVTQMHAFRLKPWAKIAVYLGYAASIVIVYFIQREPYLINEVIRIPVILYLQVFVLYGLWLVVARIMGRIDSFRASSPPPAVPAGGGD